MALCTVALYTGLRVSDITSLRRERVDWATGKLLARVLKIGKEVYIKLGQPALDALRGLPPEEGDAEHFFRNSSQSSLAQCVDSQRAIMYNVSKSTGVRGGHPHRFRHTFAIRLLEQDVPIRMVQFLLGRHSVKLTEEYYGQFQTEHQRLLDEATDKLGVEVT